MTDFSNFIPPLVSAIVGFALKFVYDILANSYKFKKELEDNNNILVTGEWYAAWQTSIDGSQLINTEHLQLVQKGKTLKMWNTERSPENPKGGFLWEAQMQFFQGRSLMGWYFAKKKESNSSKGIMYFSYLSQRRIFYGKWVGTAYDGDLINGYVVISKERELSKRELEIFIRNHPQDLALITFKGLDG